VRHNRRGFTLIEVLAVIGIILVLLGLLVGAYRHISQAAARKETIADLHICRAMLTEYENHNGISVVTNATGAGPIGPYVGDVSSRGGGARFGSGVANTMKMMIGLLQVPANRTVVEGIQAKRILEPKTNTTAITLDQGTVLLDGWGNPIIVVPPAGLVVKIKDPSDTTGATMVPYIVRTSGTYPCTPPSPPYTASVPVSAADRPFFASAGQDGDFSFGEDNVYSFQD
jgi:prepilin-type N-terminal cleavage/methylation domain-containing protein